MLNSFKFTISIILLFAAVWITGMAFVEFTGKILFAHKYSKKVTFASWAVFGPAILWSLFYLFNNIMWYE